MLKKFFCVKNLVQYAKFVVDILILAGFITIIITGILMSRSFLPAFGLTGTHSFTLKMLHVSGTHITIYLIAAHLLLNVKWLVNVFRCLFPKRVNKSCKEIMQFD
jgi:cytochrome b subunit of formate dehydrogenase